MPGILSASLPFAFAAGAFLAGGSAFAEPLGIESVEFPKSVRPGERALVKINVGEADPFALKFFCAGREQGPYAPAVVEDRKGRKDSPDAISGSLCNSMRFSFPASKTQQPGFSIWIRGQSDWAAFKGFKDGVAVKENGFRLGSAQGGLAWSHPVEFIASGDCDSFSISSSKGLGIDCVIVSPDVSFDPRLCAEDGLIGLSSGAFFVEMPKLLPGPQKLRVGARRGSEIASSEISINVEGLPQKTAKASQNLPPGASWIPLDAVANLQPNAEDVRLLDKEVLDSRRIPVGGSFFEFPAKERPFVGVWKKVDAAKLKERSVEVAQADDKVRAAQSLPESVEIPVGRQAGSLAFLHAEKGAGELGESLWSYEIAYADGSKELVSINEGKQVSGLLKGDETEEASMVWTGLVEGAPSKVYLWIWRNAKPGLAVKSVKMIAVKDKIVPVLMGLAASAAESGNGNAEPAAAVSEASVEFNCLKAVRPVRRGLFSMNNPYLASKGDGKSRVGRGMRLILGDDSWDLYRRMDFAYDRVWVGAWLPKSPDEKIDYDLAFQYSSQAMSRMGKETNTKLILNICPPKWSYDEAPGLDARIARASELCVELLGAGLKEGWPVEYVELFNETLIRHPAAEVQRKYKCFNAIAAAIKKAYPKVKISGTAECWPAVGVLEQFMVNCGKNVDALSWHLYATGDTATSTETILRNTAQMAKSSVEIEKMLKRVVPGRNVPQLITEHNINYAAWKNGGETRQKNGIGALWLLSVMRHLLYDGEADVANYWHYEFGSPYSIGNDPGVQPNPSGEAFILLNKHLRGSLLQAASSDKQIECIAADNGQEIVLALLNISPSEKSVSVKSLNLPASLDSKLAERMRKYSVAGEEKRFVCEIPQAMDFATGEFSVKMAPFSATVYLLPKP